MSISREASLDEHTCASFARRDRDEGEGRRETARGGPDEGREPMRRELQGLGAARLSQARVVHVPSERISRTVVLPLAVQHDGSIDALVAKDPAVSDRDLSDWASRQAPPARGSVQPVVLHLHPLPKGPVTAKATLPAPAPGPAVAEAPAAQAPASPGALP
jgi:hypothetical protein